MKIAVTHKEGEVFQHFGHSEEFKVYEIEDNKIVSSKILSSNGQGHGALSGLLSNNEIDTLICGNIGMGARVALGEYGIKLFPGVIGNCDIAVENFLAGTLDYNENATCSHHHEGEHNCGQHHHGCGGNH